MLLLLLLACDPGQPCPHNGLTEAELRTRFRDVPGETGLSTITRDGDTLVVETTHIPDDSVAARTVRLVLRRDADGVERTTECRAWEECQRGRGAFGMCD